MSRMKIVAAAIYHKGKVYGGLRHGEIMRQIWSEEGMETKIPQAEQGFLTDTGQFISRIQAGDIAFQAGQTNIRMGELLSEHVW